MKSQKYLWLYNIDDSSEYLSLSFSNDKIDNSFYPLHLSWENKSRKAGKGLAGQSVHWICKPGSSISSWLVNLALPLVKWSGQVGGMFPMGLFI